MINLDYYTLSTVIGVFSIITLMVFSVLMKTNTTEKGIEMWLYGSALSIVGFLSLFFKPLIGFYTTFINNTCALTGVVFILEGVLRFRGIGNQDKRRIYLFVAVVFFATISFANKTHAGTRYMYYDMLMIVMYALISYFFIRGVTGTERKLAYIYVGSFMIMGIGFTYRWILAISGVFGDDMVSGHPSTVLLFLLTIIWMPLYLYSLLLIIHYRCQKDLAMLSDTDALTGLFNRRRLEGSLQEVIEISRAYERKYVFLLMDINGFKNVNDTYGHVFGDHILMALANRIKRHIRNDDFTARYGGDEFVVLLDINQDPMTIEEAVARLRGEIEAPFNYEGYKVSLKIAIGSVVIDHSCVSLEDILSKADGSMYNEKNANHGTTIVESLEL